MCTTISLLQQHIEKQLNSTSGSGNESWVRFVVVCYCYRELLTLFVDIFRVYIYLFIYYYFGRFVSRDNIHRKREEAKSVWPVETSVFSHFWSAESVTVYHLIIRNFIRFSRAIDFFRFHPFSMFPCPRS